MSSLQHAAPAESYVAKLAREKRERRARLGWPGTKRPALPIPAPEPAPRGDTLMSLTGSARVRAEVCRHFSVSKFDLDSGRRQHNILLPRHIAMYLCRQLTTRSLPEIGRQFGGRDHTTVINAIRRIDELVVTSPSVREHVAVLTSRINGDAA